MNVVHDTIKVVDRVSVIIPTYNRQHSLLLAVNSVLQQTYPVHEILVCDDGSDDHSKQNILALKNPKVKWLDCGKNGRPAVPRNKGITTADGEWIAFLDSDDVWLPGKIEIQIQYLKKSKLQAIACNAYRIVAEKNKGPYLVHNNNNITFSDLLNSNLNICSSVLISKKLLDNISLFPEEPEYKAIEDYMLWLRISTQTDFAYIKEPLLKYFDNPNSSVRTYYKDIWEVKKVVFTGFLQWIEKNEIVLKPKDEKRLALVYKEIYSKRILLRKLKQLLSRLKTF
jgi:glycosyltransferase involved in cell wall biosynthesis